MLISYKAIIYFLYVFAAFCPKMQKDWQHYLQSQWFMKRFNAAFIAGFDMLILNYTRTKSEIWFGTSCWHLYVGTINKVRILPTLNWTKLKMKSLEGYWTENYFVAKDFSYLCFTLVLNKKFYWTTHQILQ